MTEEKVFFQAGDVKIEGLAYNAPGERGVVVTHPHPLYGGDMHNSIVETIVQAYRDKGYTTLRFNFRGMGRSTGTYDEGIGEQEDVRAALAYLAGMGKTSIDLAGYSFGAWVNALGLKGFDQARRTVMVSPPVNFLDFSFLDYSEKIRLVIAASLDDIGPPDLIKEMIPVWNPEAQFEIIQGADHFYGGKNGDIKRIIKEFLERDV
ncbi:MAG: alpha/beta fold hydrolase [Deltaproteobacteria bacterium]|nr:alpha/beta fold hydrolase [Deltaproteobacteria bacterium]